MHAPTRSLLTLGRPAGPWGWRVSNVYDRMPLVGTVVGVCLSEGKPPMDTGQRADAWGIYFPMVGLRECLWAVSLDWEERRWDLPYGIGYLPVVAGGSVDVYLGFRYWPSEADRDTLRHGAANAWDRFRDSVVFTGQDLGLYQGGTGLVVTEELLEAVVWP